VGVLILAALLLTIALYTYTQSADSRSKIGPLIEDNRLLREELSTLKGRLSQIELQLNDQMNALEMSKEELEIAQKERLKLEKERMNRLLGIQERAEQVQRVRTRLSELSAVDESAIFVRGDELVIRLPNESLFSPAQAVIAAEGKRILTEIAEVLQNEFNDLQLTIEGHTDNIPIGDALLDQFSSNWDLSSSRASAAALLIEESGWTAKKKMKVVGRGEADPIDSNETEEGRARNRRIDLILSLDSKSTGL